MLLEGAVSLSGSRRKSMSRGKRTVTGGITRAGDEMVIHGQNWAVLSTRYFQGTEVRGNQPLI
jgi:hypothetical protein